MSGSDTEDNPLSSSDSDDNIPLAKLAKKYRHERNHSDDEDDIPLLELHKRMRSRELSDNDCQKDEVMDINDEFVSDTPNALNSDNSDTAMSVDDTIVPNVSPVIKKRKQVNRVQKCERKNTSQQNVKKLFRLISDML